MWGMGFMVGGLGVFILLISRSYLVYGFFCVGFGLIHLAFGLLVKVGVLVQLEEVKIKGRCKFLTVLKSNKGELINKILSVLSER